MLSFKNVCALSILLAGQLQANDWVELQKLTPNDALEDKSKFGTSIAMSADGTTLIVGGPNENNAQGATWIYRKQTDGWHQKGSRLIAQTTQETKVYQGIAVAISGDGTRFAIGGCGDNNNMGAVWVFESKDNELPQMKCKLVGHNANGTAIYQGSSIALSSDGKKIAFGGLGDDSDRGAVWLYEYNGTEWQEGNKINSQDASINANFGASVSLSQDGSVLAIGAPFDENKGAVFIFRCTGTNCIQDETKLVPDGLLDTDTEVGHSVVLSADGKTLAISSPYDGDVCNGAVWIYKHTDAYKWIQSKKLTIDDGTFIYFGSSVAISQDGNHLLIGSSHEATYKFHQMNNKEWSQDQKIIAKDAGESKQSYSIALPTQGNIAAISGPLYNNNQGIVWIFGNPDNSQANSKDYYLSYWIPPVAGIIAGLITFGLKHIIKKHCCNKNALLPTHIKLDDPLVMIETHRGSFA